MTAARRSRSRAWTTSTWAAATWPVACSTAAAAEALAAAASSTWPCCSAMRASIAASAPSSSSFDARSRSIWPPSSAWRRWTSACSASGSLPGSPSWADASRRQRGHAGRERRQEDQPHQGRRALGQDSLPWVGRPAGRGGGRGGWAMSAPTGRTAGGPQLARNLPHLGDAASRRASRVTRRAPESAVRLWRDGGYRRDRRSRRGDRSGRLPYRHGRPRRGCSRAQRPRETPRSAAWQAWPAGWCAALAGRGG